MNIRPSKRPANRNGSKTVNIIPNERPTNRDKSESVNTRLSRQTTGRGDAGAGRLSCQEKPASRDRTVGSDLLAEA